MNKLKIVLNSVTNYSQYVTFIDNNKGITKENIGYSIYPNHAIPIKFLDDIAALFPEHTFLAGE